MSGQEANIIYMDNNATTAIAPEVLEAMLPYLQTYYGNPSSMYDFANYPARAMQKAREQAAGLIGASPEEIVFTSCGTESDSTAIFSALRRFPEKNHIVTTRVEHPAVKNLCDNVENLTGRKYHITRLQVAADGTLDLQQYRDSLTDDTAIVSVMWANNETGVMFPVEEMAKIAKERGILFHTDAVQAVGKIPINLKETAIDFLALSGHKLHAPKGIGILYVRKGAPYMPFLSGGHQEHGRRGGTENVASIVALGRACELAAANLEEENTRVRALRDKLENGLLTSIPKALLNGHKTARLPNTAAFHRQFPYQNRWRPHPEGRQEQNRQPHPGRSPYPGRSRPTASAGCLQLHPP